MPIQFEYNGLNVELSELDELEEYVSEGDVDTDKVFAQEEGSTLDPRKNLDRVICVHNIPQGVPAEKQEKLESMLCKLFEQCGKIQENGFQMPNDKDGNTLGCCFVTFEAPESAEQAIKLVNGHPFGKKNILQVYPFADMASIANWPQKYEEPARPESDEDDNVKSWLQDPALRDQFVIRHANNTEVMWCEGLVFNASESIAYDGERERRSGRVWCEMYVAWSPLGSYLATFHMQGIVLWGGEDFKKKVRFEHRNVQQIEFSPCEKYIVTWNGNCDDEDPRALVVWDVATGREMRNFKVSKPTVGDTPEWPIMKWSHDDAYFGRMLEDGISVFETKTFRLLDKKPVKAKGIQAFAWSPSDNIIAYWAPEMSNMPARVVLLDPISRLELRSKNLFSVRDVKLHWQNAGDFLCAQVLRHTKSGKTTFTNLEIFRLRDPNIPNEMTEVRDNVEFFAWEPKRERFGIIHGENQHRLAVSFYTTGAIRGGSKIEKIFSIPNKQMTKMSWSPAGNALVLSGNTINGTLEFWDVDNEVCTAEEDHFMCNDIQWDPSGRIVTTIVAQPMFGSVGMRYQFENGYIMWSFQGQQLRKQQLESFYQFSWRPRPATTLTEVEQQKITKNLKNFISKYARQDEIRKKRLDMAANKEKIDALTQYRQLIAIRMVEYAKVQVERIQLGLEEEEVDDEYEFIDETEDHVISEKIEAF